MASSQMHREGFNRNEATSCSNCWCWDDSDNRFPPHRIFFLVCSFLFYLIDIGLDIWVAVEYYIADIRDSDPNSKYYLAATLFFIIVPSIIVNFISWALYTWGWLTYRNKKLKKFCRKRLEPMKYVKHSNQRSEQDEVLVGGVHVINWSSSRRRNCNSPDPVTSLSNNHTRQSTGGVVIELEAHKDSSCGTYSVNTSTSRDSVGHRLKGSNIPILSEEGDDMTDYVETDSGLEFYPLDLFDLSEYIAVTIIHVCLLGYLFRVVRLIYMRKYDRFAFDRYRDISFLRLIESLLESAPQLVLQLYLLVIHEEAVLWYRIVTPISIIFSMVSLALSAGDYVSAAKDINYYDPPPNRERKPRLSWPGYITVVLSRLGMIVARGLAFSLFATRYGAFVFLIVGIHYFVMVYWMYWQHAHVFKHRPRDFGSSALHPDCDPEVLSWKNCIWPFKHGLCGNYGIEFIAACFNIFFHFKIKDVGTIITVIPFYLLTFVENTLMILLWYFGRDRSIFIWYGIPALVTVFAAFVFGSILLIFYYILCQPNRKNSLEPDESLDHPTMTSTLNRMYEIKVERGNFFRRILKSCQNRNTA